jgi:23S rRNA (uracil1939-C5)-methyltransferase
MSQEIRKGAELDLTIEKLAFGGKGLARLNDFVVFVERAIPGQRVRVRVTRKRRQYAEAYCFQVLAQPVHYVEPFCPHFGTCGGCLWQELPYEEQLRWKRQHVLECLEHLAGHAGDLVESTLAAPQTVYYRNKMEYTFSNRRWLMPDEIASRQSQYNRGFALGLHVRGSYDKILNIDTCFLQSLQSVGILRAVRNWCEASGLPAYSTRDHQGFWRFLIIREGKHSGQMLLHLLTASHPDQDRVVQSWAQHLSTSFPQITSIVHSVSHKKAQVATGDITRSIFGPGFIEERLGGLIFQVSAHSFFQTNTAGAARLYAAVAEMAVCSGAETVWDLYCGTGSIAIFIAHQVRRVLGFEVVREAIEDANRNRLLNGVENCSFELGDLNDIVRDPGWLDRCGGRPDVVITDPPRAGMHPRVVQALLAVAPRRIVAVSCNPSTLARDLAMLLGDYEVNRVLPVDLFPHTPHIECVVQLERRRR